MSFSDERGRMSWPGAGGEWEDFGSRFPRISRRHLLAGVIVVLVIWLGLGFYIVGPGEQGVVRQ